MITFRDFMERSLYDPETGFYPRRTVKADFYTAPELHPAFGEIIAGEISARLARVKAVRPASPLFIVEMGSGTGALARQVLSSLKEKHPFWFNTVRYILIERVEGTLLQSIVDLQDIGAKILGYTRLSDVPPFCGVVFSNELVDAMPVHLIEKRGGALREVYVADGRSGSRAELGMISSRALLHSARAVRDSLPEGGRHAVNLEARRWISGVSRSLKCGGLITVDYGKRFKPGAPNPPRAYLRHRTGGGLLAAPGRQDLTASVDFNDLIEHGGAGGLRTEWYGTLGSFLLDRGILNRLPQGQDAGAFAERAKIKTLFHPEGMGETFKVLIQEKGVSA